MSFFVSVTSKDTVFIYHTVGAFCLLGQIRLCLAVRSYSAARGATPSSDSVGGLLCTAVAVMKQMRVMHHHRVPRFG